MTEEKLQEQVEKLKEQIKQLKNENSALKGDIKALKSKKKEKDNAKSEAKPRKPEKPESDSGYIVRQMEQIRIRTGFSRTEQEIASLEDSEEYDPYCLEYLDNAWRITLETPCRLMGYLGLFSLSILSAMERDALPLLNVKFRHMSEEEKKSTDTSAPMEVYDFGYWRGEFRELTYEERWEALTKKPLILDYRFVWDGRSECWLVKLTVTVTPDIRPELMPKKEVKKKEEQAAEPVTTEPETSEGGENNEINTEEPFVIPWD